MGKEDFYKTFKGYDVLVQPHFLGDDYTNGESVYEKRYIVMINDSVMIDVTDMSKPYATCMVNLISKMVNKVEVQIGHR